MLDNSTATFHQMLILSSNQQFMFPQKNDGLICLIGKLVICHRDPPLCEEAGMQCIAVCWSVPALCNDAQ